MEQTDVYYRCFFEIYHHEFNDMPHGALRSQASDLSVELSLSPARRDKYEGFTEYWVDVQTTGSWENENEESLVDTTRAEGVGEFVTLGLDPLTGTSEIQEGGHENEGDEEDGDDKVSSISKANPSMNPATESALEAWV